MGWFNYYGLAVMAVIMIPNIVYAVRHKNDGFGKFCNKAVIASEQVGRYGCFAMMIFNIPYDDDMIEFLYKTKTHDDLDYYLTWNRSMYGQSA